MTPRPGSGHVQSSGEHDLIMEVGRLAGALEAMNERQKEQRTNQRELWAAYDEQRKILLQQGKDIDYIKEAVAGLAELPDLIRNQDARCQRRHPGGTDTDLAAAKRKKTEDLPALEPHQTTVREGLDQSLGAFAGGILYVSLKWAAILIILSLLALAMSMVAQQLVPPTPATPAPAPAPTPTPGGPAP